MIKKILLKLEGDQKLVNQVPNQEPGSPKLIPYQEPESPKLIPYQEPRSWKIWKPGT